MNNPQSTLYIKIIGHFSKPGNIISKLNITLFAHAESQKLNDIEIKEVVFYACDALGVELIESEITPAPHAGVIVSDELNSYLK